ncbi:MAG: ribosomal RNA small subunit methyltransferase A [Gemmataceae bacterium]
MADAEPRSPRQTLSYLKELFAARGIRPKNKMGQNFLVDLNLLQVLVRAAELSRSDLVIEVGSGTGGLTARLAEHAGWVLGVEIDRGLYELARDNTAALTNVQLLHADILAGKNKLNPQVVAAMRQALDRPGLATLKLVSNLPYVVATPVIGNFLVSDLPLERLVVTVQWEVAERLAAAPGTKAYNALSVLVQSLADVEILRRMPPQVFWPRPKVDSAIVRIWPRSEKRSRIPDVHGFHRFVHDLYLHRRKNLRSALWPRYRSRCSKEQLDVLLRQHGFDPQARSETLSVDEHLRLYGALAMAPPPVCDTTDWALDTGGCQRTDTPTAPEG